VPDSFCELSSLHNVIFFLIIPYSLFIARAVYRPIGFSHVTANYDITEKKSVIVQQRA